MTRYYLDTNALYAFYRHNMVSLIRHPNYQHYQTLTGGTTLQQLTEQGGEFFVSRLTYLEFIGRLLRHARGKELKKRDLDLILEALERDIGQVFKFIPQTDRILHDAQALLLTHAQRGGCALDTNDAIHIATALSIQPAVTLITSDGGKAKGETLSKMKCVCQRVGLAFFDPELEQTN